MSACQSFGPVAPLFVMAKVPFLAFFNNEKVMVIWIRL